MSSISTQSSLVRAKFVNITSIPHVIGALLGILVFRFIARIIYRLYFHPLRRFPGPKLRAATRIPDHITVFKGTRDNLLQDLHRKYGHIVRVNHDELSFTDPNAWKDIYGHGTKGTTGSIPQKNWNKYGTPPNGSPSMIFARDQVHTRQRKIFTSAFSDRALKQQEPLFIKYADKLVARLRQIVQDDPNGKLDLVRPYNFATFDVMGDLTFGESLHMLDNAEYDPWVRVIFASLKFAAYLTIVTAYPWSGWLFKKLLGPSVNRKRMENLNYSITRVTKRLEKGRDADGVDLWDHVLNQEEGQGLTRGEMDANASLFMVAGTETTATLLSGLTYLLLRNPECMKKLSDDIRGAFASDADMTMERLAAMPYLAACIREAFRLYPPIPLGLPRVTPEDGSTVVGHFIPPNTGVSIPHHAMFTHEKNFRRPYEYLPQRWLGDSEFDGDAKHCVQPFTLGPHDCVGKNMAYHEIRLIIAKVLYNFDMELCPESNNWNEQKVFTFWEKLPLICKLRPVN